VVGVDFSGQSVQTAKKKAAANNLTNIDYRTGGIEAIKDLYNGYFDGIVWGMGLNYFQDLDVVLDGLQSCLASQGWLVCSFVHPIVWAGDYIQDESGRYGRNVFHYFTSDMQAHQWKNVARTDGNPFVTRNYPYTFQKLTAALSNNNFYIDLILEPHPLPEKEQLDPDLYHRLLCCPQFAIIKAVKKS
jgi:ubiquinone/menaquinone biosynthesis C-methylase UbiE